MWRSIVLTAALLAVAPSQACVKRRSPHSGEDDGHYCVCDAKYCDVVPSVRKLQYNPGYTLVTSSKAGLRFQVSTGSFGFVRSEEAQIVINASDYRQEIVGFGGAVTDSAALNILSLSEATSEKLLRSYFAVDGNEYTIIRTPLGGSDFSNRKYGYAPKENDTLLENFSLQPEDYEQKIPVIRRALELSNRGVKLLTAPWSPDPWMKTENAWSSEGMIRKEYWPTYANYFVKYFEAYKRKGIDFWALTPQNEPLMSTYAQLPLNGASWTPEDEREFIVNHLAPALEKSGFGRLQILIGDDNRQSLPEWPSRILGDEEARRIVAGTAVHWYFDNRYPSTVLDETKRLFPEKLIHYTEACTGVKAAINVKLGSWKRGEEYAANIIEDMSHWVSSWIDWNLALDLEGGPTWVRNFVDAPIIVNATADEFYKQPMFYAMGHFSKYIPPGSRCVGTTAEELGGVKHVAFATPDEATVLVLLNTEEVEREIVVQDTRKGPAKLFLAPKSLNTMKYW